MGLMVGLACYNSAFGWTIRRKLEINLEQVRGREGWASGWDGGMNGCWLREGGHIASGCDGQIYEVGGYSQIKCNSRLLKLLADLSARWPRPSVMYPSLSSTTWLVGLLLCVPLL